MMIHKQNYIKLKEKIHFQRKRIKIYNLNWMKLKITIHLK